MDKDRLPNIDLGKTQITDKIRVSSAAIFYQEMFGDYYQIETWIFSDDKSLKSRMFIHGNTCGTKISEKEIELTSSFHRRVSKILLLKNQVNYVG